MGKTAKEKAKEWGCSPSTVRAYCASGIIPPAEQIGLRRVWSIPDEWPKPPMTSHGLCFLLDTIYQLNQDGVEYAALKLGYTEEEIKAGFDYLISAAFMSSINTSNLSTTLRDATVTKRGEALIERENKKSKTKFRAHVTARASIGVAEVEVGAEVEN